MTNTRYGISVIGDNGREVYETAVVISFDPITIRFCGYELIYPKGSINSHEDVLEFIKYEFPEKFI